MKAHEFEVHISSLKQKHRQLRTLCWVAATSATTALLIALYGLWTSPLHISYILFCLLPGCAFLFVCRETRPTFDFSKLRLFFDMQHPQGRSPFNPQYDIQSYAEHEYLQQQQSENQLTRNIAQKTLPFAFFSTLLTGLIWSQFSLEVSGLQALLPTQVSLSLQEGHFTNTQETTHILSGNTLSLETHKDNLFRLHIRPHQEKPLALELLADDKSVIQSLQLNDDYQGQQTPQGHILDFTIAKDAFLSIPQLQDEPFAQIHILTKPRPKVSLELMSTYQDPWPDHQDIPLKIQVTSQNPLQKVLLEFEVNGKKHQEVLETMTTNVHQSLHDHALHIEPYLQDDMASVTITALAYDQSSPRPFVGHSDPIFLKVASAYGRYLKTLGDLQQVKQHVDQRVAEGSPSMGLEKISQNMQQVIRSSNDSPFFDGLDRIELSQIRSMLTPPQQVSPTTILNASRKIDKFLQEHEMLNDRERDRDFFVALRGLSRLVETTHSNRKYIQAASESLSSFIKERHKRWEQRVSRLQSTPARWPQVSKQPFSKALQTATNGYLNETLNKEETLRQFAQLSHDYRAWLNELEGLEDKQRASQEQQRQQGLASAKEALRELQKRQAKISTQLDQADLKTQHIEDEWPLVRMEQNTNIKGSRKLTAQLQALAPEAAQRLQAARDSMVETVKSGEESQYSLAETFADRAGRLLREAKRKTSQAQQQSQRRGRRRRVNGDKYYGRSVSGGVDLQREYKVDRKYREDILDEVSRSESRDNPDDANLLNSYLRGVIR